MSQRRVVDQNKRDVIRISDKILPPISLLAEMIPGPLVIFDKKGKVTVTNKSANRIFGKPSILGTAISSIFPITGKLNMSNLIQNGEMRTFSQRINGSSIRFTIRGIPYLDIGQVFPSFIAPVNPKLSNERSSKKYNISIYEQRLNKGLREAYQDLVWSVYKNSVLPTFMERRDGEIIYYNDSMFALTGYNHEEVHNIDLWMNKLYPNKEYREKVIEDDLLVRSRYVSISKVKYLITRKDGEQRYVEFMVYDILHEGKSTDLQLVQVEDVNERETFAESLRISKASLAEAQRIAHLGSWEVDLASRRLTSSEQMYDLLGISDHEIDITLDIISNCVHPDERDLFSRWLASCLSQDVIEEIEFRVILPTGAVRIMNGQSKVIYDEKGKPVKMLGIIQDITDRKAREEEYRYLLDEMGDAYFIVQDEKFVFLNKKFTEILAMKKRQILGRSVGKVFAPEIRTQVLQLHRMRLAGMQVPMRYNAVVINGLGERVPVGITAWVNMFRGKPAVGAIMVNISDRIRRQYEYAKVQEEERRRLARAIHDDTIQELLVINHGMKDIISGRYGHLPESASGHLSHLGSVLEQTTSRLRDHTLLLRPSILDDLGLIPALKWLADRLTATNNINTEVTVIGNMRRLPTEVELALFRVAQEALNNVKKHSQATMALLEVVFSEAKIYLRIEDNGIGFKNPVEINHFVKEGKLGLLGMTERVVLLGGTYKVHSVPGKGTVIKVEVNYPSKMKITELSERGLEQAGFLKKT